MEDYTEFHDITLTLTLTLSEYVRLHRGFSHYRNFFKRNALSEKDFAVLQEIVKLQNSLNDQVNAQMDAQLTN